MLILKKIAKPAGVLGWVYYRAKKSPIDKRNKLYCFVYPPHAFLFAV